MGCEVVRYCIDLANRRCRLWTSGTATMELADAALVWIPFDHVLAGTWSIGAELDSIRRSSWLAARWTLAPSQVTLGADDSGGAGKISARNERPLRALCAANTSA